MDYKVADLRKKLNKLKHESRLKADRIARLMKDYEKVVHLNAEMVRKVPQVFVEFTSPKIEFRKKLKKYWKTPPRDKD